VCIDICTRPDGSCPDLILPTGMLVTEHGAKAREYLVVVRHLPCGYRVELQEATRWHLDPWPDGLSNQVQGDDARLGVQAEGSTCTDKLLCISQHDHPRCLHITVVLQATSCTHDPVL
jgi:hypothetical protein